MSRSPFVVALLKLCFCGLALTCAHSLTPSGRAESNAAATPETTRLRHFGLSVVEPSCAVVRELSPFASVMTVQATHPRFAELVACATTYGMKVAVETERLLFRRRAVPGEVWQAIELRSDYERRWQDFVERHRKVVGYGTVFGLYVVDEPFWHRVDVADLVAAEGLIKATYPLIPTVASLNWQGIEAAPEDLPDDLFDVVGYHAYAVANDLALDPDYQRHLDLLRDKLPGRDLLIVVDAWWTPGHAAAGLALEDMGQRARQYQEVAAAADAVILAGFVWESLPGSVGLRDFPDAVLREYAAIGSEVTGKCGVPAGEPPRAGAHLLFLQGCRFHVEVDWRIPWTGEVGRGVAVPVSRDTGLFWFFSEANVELTVKVLDGRPVNGSWWVFWSHMTTLELTVEVTDRETGEVRIYTEPVTDTSAFPEHRSRPRP